MLAIIAFFFVTGQAILDFWGISLEVLQITGGLLIARTAWTFTENYRNQTVNNYSQPNSNFRFFYFGNFNSTFG